MNALLPPRAEVRVQVRLRGVLALALRRHRQQSIGFQDDDDIRVLVQDADALGQPSFVRLQEDLDPIAGVQLPLRILLRFAIHAHAGVLQQLPQRGVR